MTTYNIKSRKLGATTVTNVDGASPEAAIKTFVSTAAAGEEILVMVVNAGTGPTGTVAGLMAPGGMSVAGPTGLAQQEQQR